MYGNVDTSLYDTSVTNPDNIALDADPNPAWIWPNIEKINFFEILIPFKVEKRTLLKEIIIFE